MSTAGVTAWQDLQQLPDVFCICIPGFFALYLSGDKTSEMTAFLMSPSIKCQIIGN